MCLAVSSLRKVERILRLVLSSYLVTQPTKPRYDPDNKEMKNPQTMAMQV